MPPVSVLIKPASSACNMRCTYCFYRDEAKNRATAFTGMLSAETAELLVAEALRFADGSCSFLFQGGEPTLCGLPFFEQFLGYEKKYNKAGIAIHHAIQTNGFGLDSEWASFFKRNRFLVGLSLDGTAELHNLCRQDAAGKDTFSSVLQTAALFDKSGVDYNILSVVTGVSARHIEKIWRFFRKQNFHWLQFIPCIAPLDGSSVPEALSPQAYGAFLIRVFGLWVEDLRKGCYTSVRHIDNYLSMWLGRPPENCGMNGRCGIQFAVEGDGGVYPCDFYVLDEWRLGTVGENSFDAMLHSQTARRFVESSLHTPDACAHCRWFSLCRNGCRRDRAPLAADGRNIYCDSYKAFFEACVPQFNEAIRLLQKN